MSKVNHAGSGTSPTACPHDGDLYVTYSNSCIATHIKCRAGFETYLSPLDNVYHDLHTGNIHSDSSPGPSFCIIVQVQPSKLRLKTNSKKQFTTSSEV